MAQSTLPETMQAWRISQGKADPLVKKTIPVPKPQPGELLVKVQAMGVCHSDCAILATPTPPPGWHEEFTIGHEGAGEIVQLGPGPDDGTDYDFKVGDKVAIHIVPGCKLPDCIHCGIGLSRICQAPGNGGYGLGRDGFMAEYVACRADAAVKIPDGVPIEAACLAPDALLTAYHAVKYTAEVTVDDTIAILGLGGLGLNALQTAQHIGVKRILVLDRRQEAVDSAIRLGIRPEDAFCTADPTARSIQDVVKDQKIRIDKVIDFVGHEETHLAAQLIVRPGGLIVMVGLLASTMSLISVQMIMNLTTIRGSFAGTAEGLRECLDLIVKGVIKPQLTTTSVENLPQILQDLDDGKIDGRKVLLPDWKR